MLAIYTRLSSQEEDSSSIENQLREGKQFAKKHNFTELIIYNEGEGVSGGLSVEDRPELKRLISDISSKRITTVWFRNQNRLERNAITFHLFVDIVKRLNVDVYFNDTKADYNEASTYLQSSIISSINVYQRELQAQQTKKAIKNNLEEGKVHGISAYGYTKDENRLMIIDEDEAKVVKRIYDMSLNGIGTIKIAETFNKEHIPTRYNKINKGTLTTKDKYSKRTRTVKKADIKWSGETIRKIIKNSIYKGVRIVNEIEYESPVIIKEDYWLKVNENLKENRNNSGVSVKHKYLLKGLLRCGKCGRNMYGRTRVNKSDNYYMCSSKRYKHENCGNRSINIDKLDELIWTKFICDGQLSKVVSEHFKTTSNEDNISTLESELSTLEASLKTTRNNKSKLINAVLNEVLSNEDIKSKMKVLKTEEADLIIKIKNKNSELDIYKNSENSLDKILNELNISPKIDFNSKQQILHKYINDITIEFFGEYYVIDIDFNIQNIESFRYIFVKNYKYAHATFGNKIEYIILDSEFEEAKEIDLKIYIH